MISLTLIRTLSGESVPTMTTITVVALYCNEKYYKRYGANKKNLQLSKTMSLTNLHIGLNSPLGTKL